jgi:hypothetical protein
MKYNTNVFIAIRNVGDAQDAGKVHEASLSQAILWMATELSHISMAGRIVVGIGRNQADALKGINVKSMGRNAVSEDMKSLLDSVFSGDMTSDQATERAANLGVGVAERIPGDDYVA